jgi:hypothetical protein
MWRECKPGFWILDVIEAAVSAALSVLQAARLRQATAWQARLSLQPGARIVCLSLLHR